MWLDYTFLERSRPVGMSGRRPIPFDILDRYAARFGPHEPERFRWWCRMIHALDDEILSQET